MVLSLHKTYHVTAVDYVKHGVIVSLADNTTRLIHLSKISSEYVNDPKDYVPIGSEYDAMCVKGQGDQLELSLLHLDLKLKRQVPSKDLDTMISEANAAYADKYPKRAQAQANMRSRRKRNRIPI